MSVILVLLFPSLLTTRSFVIVVMVKVTCAVIDRPQGDGVEGATRFEHMIVPFYLSRASKNTLNQTLI